MVSPASRRAAVVLLSGGLDSYTAAAIARHEGFELFALTVGYGQRHAHELESARAVARALGVSRHIECDVNLSLFGGSSLTSSDPVPKDRPLDAGGIPSTYVPARNTVFLSLALAWAEVVGARDIFIGVNAIDYSGYPDCRPEFIAAFEQLARLATKAGVEGRGIEIRAPLIHMSKAQIVREGTRLGVDYSLKSSFYQADVRGLACGLCDYCKLRREGFVSAGLSDPTRYRFPEGQGGAHIV